MNIKRIIREESNDFKWIEDTQLYLNGIKFIYGEFQQPVYTIVMETVGTTEMDKQKIKARKEVIIIWEDKAGMSSVNYKITEVYKNFEDGVWNIVDDSGLNESDESDMKWIEDIGIGEPIEIGGPVPNWDTRYDDDDPNYPIDYVYVGDRVEFAEGYTFTIEKIKKDPLSPHKITSVWGSDIPESEKTFGVDRKLNWHFVEWLKRADLNESNEFDWIEDS